MPEKRDNRQTGLMIQVRMNSSRLPGKAMISIGGRPLLARLINNLSPVSDTGKIIIATSRKDADDPIVELAESEGIPYYRGDEEDALSRFIEAAKKFGIDIIVRITGDNPFTDPTGIKIAVACLKQEGLDYAGTTGLPLGTCSEVCTLAALKRAGSMAKEPIHRENITSFFYRNPDKFKIRILNISNLPYSRPGYRLTVDTKEDLLLMERIYRILGDSPSLADVVTLLDSRFDLVSINSHIIQRILPL